MNKYSRTKEAGKIRKAISGVKIYSADDVYTQLYLKRDQLGLPVNLSYEYILWVIANDIMKETQCEGCEYVADRCLMYQGSPLNRCNNCAYNPDTALPVKYSKNKNIEMYES